MFAVVTVRHYSNLKYYYKPCIESGSRTPPEI